MHITKQEIRKEILKKRAGLDEKERERAEVLVTERILGHQWFYLSDTLLCFVNYGTEISTEAIWTEALRLGSLYAKSTTGSQWTGNAILQNIR